MVNMDKILELVIERDASDVHLICGNKPILRIARELEPIEEMEVLTPEDMNEIYDEMYKADVIVLACPVYFYTWPSLMKRMIDRTFAIEDSMDKKIFYLLSAAATRKEINVQTMIKCFRQYISCFGENGSEEGGIIFAYDTRKTDDVKNMHDILNKVYEMGKNV